MDNRLARLRASLAAATELEVLPPTSEADVAGFEARYGITLPLEYRRFLLEVAEGISLGGEPQLYALRDFAGGVDLTRPFWYGAADADAILAAIAAAGPGGPLADRAVMALQRSGDPDGCLTLAGNGGNDFSVIVVSGEQPGRMWRTGELDAPETRALYDGGGDVEPLSFLDWIVPWASCFLGVELDT
ncbi:MAG: SMI1/KNR4 family protein [Myxococcales bacterium]|nr:SMI1/KNR4 family protein [Myxococcales bacterium]